MGIHEAELPWRPCILPEEPGNNWPDFSDEDVRTFSRRIGNLALMLAKTNSDLKSSKFADKRGAYKDSPYELTRMVAREPRWGTNQIVSRQMTLSDYALKAWPL